MPQLEKYLLYRHGGLTSVFSIHTKSWVWWPMPVIQIMKRQKWENSWGLQPS